MTRTADHAAAHGWDALAVSDVRLQLEWAANQGLSPREAARRFDQHGPNTLPEAKHRTMWTVLAGQFVSPLIDVLFVAAVIALAMG
jgi:Ca2+-transporting ATPase